MKERYVVLFSTGLSSAMSLNRAITLYGIENVVALFTDTKWEDEDNYRFMEDIKKRYPDLRFEYRADGRTPREVFLSTRWLGNSRLGNCSVHLKVMQTHKFLEELKAEEIVPSLIFGIGSQEEERAYNLKQKYPNYRCLFPMIEEPLTNTEMTNVIEDQWGIQVPRMYKLGFSHANCGGRCVRGGLKHWAHLFHTWPERYLEAEGIEREFQCKVNPDVTILTRTIKGQKYPLSLKKYRKQLEWNLFDYLNYEDDEEEICSMCVI